MAGYLIAPTCCWRQMQLGKHQGPSAKLEDGEQLQNALEKALTWRGDTSHAAPVCRNRHLDDRSSRVESYCTKRPSCLIIPLWNHPSTNLCTLGHLRICRRNSGAHHSETVRHFLQGAITPNGRTWFKSTTENERCESMMVILTTHTSEKPNKYLMTTLIHPLVFSMIQKTPPSPA